MSRNAASVMLNQALRNHGDVVSLHDPEGLVTQVCAIIGGGDIQVSIDRLRTEHFRALQTGAVLIVWRYAAPVCSIAAPMHGKAVGA